MDMSLPEVRRAITDWQIDNDWSQTPGTNTARVAQELFKVARKADITPPSVSGEILVWAPYDDSPGGCHPTLDVSQYGHYALGISDGNEYIIVNPVPAVGFPQWNNRAQIAPGLLQEMRPLRLGLRKGSAK